MENEHNSYEFIFVPSISRVGKKYFVFIQPILSY